MERCQHTKHYICCMATALECIIVLTHHFAAVHAYIREQQTANLNLDLQFFY